MGAHPENCPFGIHMGAKKTISVPGGSVPLTTIAWMKWISDLRFINQLLSSERLELELRDSNSVWALQLNWKRSITCNAVQQALRWPGKLWALVQRERKRCKAWKEVEMRDLTVWEKPKESISHSGSSSFSHETPPLLYSFFAKAIMCVFCFQSCLNWDISI